MDNTLNKTELKLDEPKVSTSNTIIASSENNNLSKNDISKKVISHTKFISRVAVFAALMVASKFITPFAPFLDWTALLLISFCLAFDFKTGIFTSIVFVIMGALMWSIGWWLLTWIIWYPALALCISFLPKKNKYSPLFAALVGIAFVCVFSALSSMIYVLTTDSEGINVFIRFGAFYAAGIVNTLLYIGSTTVVLLALIYPLSREMKKLNRQSSVKTTSKKDIYENLDSDNNH